MSAARLSSLAILHIHKHNDVDIDNVVLVFARLKGRRLALCLLTLENTVYKSRNCPKRLTFKQQKLLNTKRFHVLIYEIVLRK